MFSSSHIFLRPIIRYPLSLVIILFTLNYDLFSLYKINVITCNVGGLNKWNLLFIYNVAHIICNIHINIHINMIFLYKNPCPW